MKMKFSDTKGHKNEISIKFQESIGKFPPVLSLSLDLDPIQHDTVVDFLNFKCEEERKTHRVT